MRRYTCEARRYLQQTFNGEAPDTDSGTSLLDTVSSLKVASYILLRRTEGSLGRDPTNCLQFPFHTILPKNSLMEDSSGTGSGVW